MFLSRTAFEEDDGPHDHARVDRRAVDPSLAPPAFDEKDDSRYRHEPGSPNSGFSDVGLVFTGAHSSSRPQTPSIHYMGYDTPTSSASTGAEYGGLSASSVARRQKMMEQQRAQIQQRKAKNLTSGMLRPEAGSPSRPSSAGSSGSPSGTSPRPSFTAGSLHSAIPNSPCDFPAKHGHSTASASTVYTFGRRGSSNESNNGLVSNFNEADTHTDSYYSPNQTNAKVMPSFPLSPLKFRSFVCVCFRHNQRWSSS